MVAPAVAARFRCLGCGTVYPLAEPRTSCAACGELLDVEPDLEAFGHSGNAWRDLFERRRAAPLSPGTLPHERSGVWRYREHVLPGLDASLLVSKPEGATRLYAGGALGEELGLARLFVKHEGENPTLSFKDRGMTAGVTWAKACGFPLVGCASTGDTSAALAAYAAEVPGMRAVVLLPHDKISDEQLAQALAYGATTFGLDTDFDGCMKIVAALADEGRVYLLNSKNAVRLEGQKTIAFEAIHDLGWTAPDWFVVPVGNAGNISAIGKGLREWLSIGILDKKPRLAGIQADAADPFYRSYKTGFAERVTRVAGETAASAIRIGAPVSHAKAQREIGAFDGVVERVTEAELLDVFALAGRHGLAICPNSAVALAGAAKLRREGTIRRDDLVVVVATAHALKFSRTMAAYHRGTGSLANPPRRLPATLDAVRAALGEIRPDRDCSGRRSG
ncbi:MAG: threonine synthase [Thermoanaerobaculia bacterium]|jgi:threonine synthase